MNRHSRRPNKGYIGIVCALPALAALTIAGCEDPKGTCTMDLGYRACVTNATRAPACEDFHEEPALAGIARCEALGYSRGGPPARKRLEEKPDQPIIFTKPLEQ